MLHCWVHAEIVRITTLHGDKNATDVNNLDLMEVAAAVAVEAAEVASGEDVEAAAEEAVAVVDLVAAEAAVAVEVVLTGGDMGEFNYSIHTFMQAHIARI